MIAGRRGRGGGVLGPQLEDDLLVSMTARIRGILVLRGFDPGLGLVSRRA